MTTPEPATMLPAIEREVLLRAAPDRVWHALTDPAELAAWFGVTADLAIEEGAEGSWAWEGTGRFAVRVEAVDIGRYLRIRGSIDADVDLDEARSLVTEWTIVERPGGGTILHIRETGFRDGASRHGNVVGWLDVASGLSRHLASEPWEAGVRRTYTLRSAPARVWRAFADPDEFRRWWAGDEPVPLEEGREGSWVWPGMGRFAMRIDAVEPERYLAWRWTPEPETPLEAAATVLRTQWVFVARDDGGTDLHLFESGFTEPEGWRLNSSGWDGDVLPGLRKVLGETDPG